MIYKYESVYTILEKLYRDYDHQEELDIWDVVEWAAEALELIGAGQQYEKRVAELEIKNSMSPLPCNFHSQPIASYKGRPMNYATGSFAPLIINPEDSSENVINGFPVSGDNFPATENSSSEISDKQIPNTFYVRDGVFVTNIPEGVVVLEYRGTKVDNEGFPMIPDNQYYREAITTYCQMKIDRRDWRKKRISKEVYAESKQDWQWFCGGARGSANMPNLSYSEAIKDQWVKLRPNQNAYQTFYSDQTLREMRKLK